MNSARFTKFIAYILIIALLIISVFTLSACSDSDEICGTWLYQSAQGHKYYYTFYDSDGKGKLEISCGTTSFMCTYEINDNMLVTSYKNGEIYGGNFLGTYSYEIVEEDNKFMILTDFDGEKYKLKAVEKPDNNKLLKKYDNFRVDKKLVGNWIYDYEDLGATLELTVKLDGTMVLNLSDLEYQNYVYTADGSSLKFTRILEEKIEETKPYKVSGKKLEFLGLEWSKE